MNRITGVQMELLLEWGGYTIEWFYHYFTVFTMGYLYLFEWLIILLCLVRIPAECHTDSTALSAGTDINVSAIKYVDHWALWDSTACQFFIFGVSFYQLYPPSQPHTVTAVVTHFHIVITLFQISSGRDRVRPKLNNWAQSHWKLVMNLCLNVYCYVWCIYTLLPIVVLSF